MTKSDRLSAYRTLLCTTTLLAASLAANAAHAEMRAAPTVEELTTCDATESSVVRIGILAPITGPTAADASDYSRAAGLAAEELNKAGGVCAGDQRYTFELVEADATEMRNDAVVTAFRRLNSTEGLNIILGPYASTSNFEIDLMAQAQMPYIISGGAESTEAIIAANPDNYPTVWSRVPNYDGYFTDLPPLLNRLTDEGKLKLADKTVFVIGSDDPYGSTIANGLVETFKSLGWNVVGQDTVPFQSVNDWRTQLARIRDVNPAVIVNTEWSASGSATFFNQFYEQPTNSLLFLQYAPSIPEFQTITRNQAVGVMYSMLGGAIDTRSDTKEIAAKFAERFGPGGYFSIAGYNAVQLYALCLNQGIDPTDRLAVGQCIGKLDVDTPSGRLAFDPATHLAIQGDDYMPTLFYQVQEDGSTALIAPAAVAETDFITSPWMQ